MDENLRLAGSLFVGILLLILTAISTGTLSTMFLVLFFVGVCYFIYTSNKSTKNAIKDIHDGNHKFINDSDVKFDDYAFSDDGVRGIAINEKEKKLYILKRKELNEKYDVESYNFKSIIESGIVEDDVTITKTSKSGMIGGSLLGGLVGGSFIGGALVGGMASDKTSSEMVSKMTLSIVVDSLTNPVENIVFLVNTLRPFEKQNPIYKNKFESCNMWHKRISVIIKRNEN